MSRENVALVRRLFEQFMKTGRTLPAALAGDFVWDMTTFRGWPEDPTYAGGEGFERFMTSWRESFGDWQAEIEESHDAGDHVVLVVGQSGVMKGSGSRIEMHFAQVWTIRDGMIARIALYADPADALAAVRRQTA